MFVFCIDTCTSSFFLSLSLPPSLPPSLPNRKKMQGHQRTFNKDEEDGGAVANSYTTLTLHPSVQLPPSPESILVSSIFSAEIDPKWEFNRENIQLTEVLNEGQFTVLYKGIAKGIREKPIEVAVKSVKGERGGELGVR